MKYLGVILDRAMTFGEHVKAATTKADNLAMKMARLMPNVRGPSSMKRIVLAEVVHTVLLYGEEIWHSALEMEWATRKLESVQRRLALRVCSGYRTMSVQAAQVIAGLIPIDLHGRLD